MRNKLETFRAHTQRDRDSIKKWIARINQEDSARATYDFNISVGRLMHEVVGTQTSKISIISQHISVNIDK